MKGFWKVAFGLICGLLSAGVILLASNSPRGKAITLSPPPPPEPIQVHVTGAVKNPGLYELPGLSRVGDAIRIAGGLTTKAYSQTLNLAAFLQDGERVFVPYQPTESPPNNIIGSQGAKEATVDPLQPININTASQVELERLPGIGPKIALRIIDYRNLHGPFDEIEDIQNVSGIGPKTFEDLKGLITVEISP